MRLFEVVYEYDDEDEFNEHRKQMVHDGYCFMSSCYTQTFNGDVIKVKYAYKYWLK